MLIIICPHIYILLDFIPNRTWSPNHSVLVCLATLAPKSTNLFGKSHTVVLQAAGLMGMARGELYSIQVRGSWDLRDRIAEIV
jgi:hypothetical protein